MNDAITANQLGRETSPYLRQHAHNPVHWRPWGKAALAEAQRLNRPILLSVGYAACHWCHVMAHESFEDAETADLMNRLFVNIKVDREERPDIDHIYMRALQALGEQGGWPLTMFLTPDGEPVWGGTYFPKTARYGRPAFADVLNSVARTFNEAPDRVAHNISALVSFLSAIPGARDGEPGQMLLDQAAGTIAEMFDREKGGLRGAPKFPQPTLLELLSRTASTPGDRSHLDIVDTTLRTMLQGGIYDHIGGGLARYSVDDRWLVPHFEKMLYDNSLLIERATAAWRRSGLQLFRVRIEETIAWLLREMRVEGGFASSLDADSGDGEGAFYVWRPDELVRALGADAARAFGSAYDITAEGNFEGASIPNRLAHLDLFDDATERRLAGYREQLLAIREQRQRPARDDKILADWNGLAISSLAEAAMALSRPDWLKASVEAYRFVSESMMIDGRLRHSYKDGRVLDVGFASDSGAMMRAALTLYQATLEPHYIAAAQHCWEILDRHYWDDSVAAWRLTADDADGLIVRPLPIHDDSVPSANAVIAEATARLWRLTGTDRYAERIDALFARHLGDPGESIGKAGLLNALDQHLDGRDFVVAEGNAGDIDSWVAAFHRHRGEASNLFVVAGDRPLPSGHPAHGKAPIEGATTAYVCSATACSAPIKDLAGFTRNLAGEGGSAV